MTQISEKARELLAEAYKKDNKPWFAYDILRGRSKQFDLSLIVITEILNAQMVEDTKEGKTSSPKAAA